MSDDACLVSRFLLILGNEIERAGESDLVDVLLNLILCHSDTVVFKGDSLVIVIVSNGDLVLVLIILGSLAQFHESSVL